MIRTSEERLADSYPQIDRLSISQLTKKPARIPAGLSLFYANIWINPSTNSAIALTPHKNMRCTLSESE